MSTDQLIARTLKIQPDQVRRTLALLDDGNTVPFIARYRKEVTGELDEEQIRQIEAQAGRLRALEERRETILRTIGEQGNLTPALEKSLRAADTLTALEDLYQPFKPKRQTRAEAARRRGLQPLADLILAQERRSESLAELARPFLNDEVPDVEAAWAGARDIVAETISDHPDVRGPLREKSLKFAQLRVEKMGDAVDEKAVYRLYYDFNQRVDRLRPHQVLAIDRGEKEKILRVTVEIDQKDWLRAIASVFLPRRGSPFQEQLDLALRDGAGRLLLPAIERDVRRHLTERAGAHAIRVFATNLRGLLTQPPIAGSVVLGIDPGYRTGCKLAVIDATGRVLDTATIYPHGSSKQKYEALERLSGLVQKHQVGLIAIGNGTASRETEQLVAELISLRAGRPAASLHYLIASEAGASVYSASPLARAELPDLDVTLRGAVSIARRVQDPRAELVKIDPKSIGIGLYQHDVDQKALAAALDQVVESVVNQVGVDVNSASPALLTYVAGIGPRLAEGIIAHRDAEGPFGSREALKAVRGLGPKSFEQAAGFLRIRGGRNWLDGSAIHPESYTAAVQVARRAGITPEMGLEAREKALAALSPAALAAELQIGLPTLRDIFDQLVRPGRDPREDLPTPILRQDVLKVEDLQVGMRLAGTVRNVVDFGAFVDIGVKQDGLLHRSRLPREADLAVGDVLEVEIVSLELDRGRIGLGAVES